MVWEAVQPQVACTSCHLNDTVECAGRESGVALLVDLSLLKHRARVDGGISVSDLVPHFEGGRSNCFPTVSYVFYLESRCFVAAAIVDFLRPGLASSSRVTSTLFDLIAPVLGIGS